MPKKKPLKGKPKVTEELEGLDIEINELGQIVDKYDKEKVIKFLNKHVDDKKLRDRKDIGKEGDFKNTEFEEKKRKGTLEKLDELEDDDQSKE
jgi:hypothetical protein